MNSKVLGKLGFCYFSGAKRRVSRYYDGGWQNFVFGYGQILVEGVGSIVSFAGFHVGTTVATAEPRVKRLFN